MTVARVATLPLLLVLLGCLSACGDAGITVEVAMKLGAETEPGDVEAHVGGALATFEAEALEWTVFESRSFGSWDEAEEQGLLVAIRSTASGHQETLDVVSLCIQICNPEHRPSRCGLLLDVIAYPAPDSRVELAPDVLVCGPDDNPDGVAIFD